MAAIDKDARNEEIVAAYFRGIGAAQLSRTYDLAERTIREIVQKWRLENPPMRDKDPLELIDDLMDGYRAAIEELALIAATSGSTGTRVAAIRGRIEVMGKQTELLQAVGKLPKNLGELRIHLDVRYVAETILRILDEENIDESVIERLMNELSRASEAPKPISSNQVVPAVHDRRARNLTPDLSSGPMLSETMSDLFGMRLAERRGRRISFLDWSLRVPEPKTGTLDFARYPFQLELYDEGATDKEAVIKKATQVGISTYALRWAMYWADVRGWSGLYVFPRLKQMYDFSDARIRPAILGSEYLRDRVPLSHVQNKGLKQVGHGYVYFRGSESVIDLDSVDADHLVLDEYDTLRPDNIPHAEKRVGASDYGYIRRVGVPSLPDSGIAQLYDESDQRRWFVRCGKCGERQALDFWKNVDLERRLRVCADVDCRAPLDVTQGEWVAEHPERDIRGYHVTRLIVPTDRALEEVIAASEKRRPFEIRTFYNKELGLEYVEKEGRLSDEALQAAQTAGGEYIQGPRDSGYVGTNLVTMGVDVASARNLNVRISEHYGSDDGRDRKRALFIGEVENFDVLAELMVTYKVNMAVIDHLPEGRMARGFAERFAGLVYLCAYTTNAVDPQVIRVEETARFLKVRRVEAIDATLHMIREQRNHLPMDWPEDYASHLKAVMREVQEDEAGRKTVRYVTKPEGHPDDYLHAEVYDLIATEAWWLRQQVAEAERDTFTRLEDHFEFQRSGLSDIDAEQSYEPGLADYDGMPLDEFPD